MGERRRRRAAVAEILLLCAAIASVLRFAHSAATSWPSLSPSEKFPVRTYLGFDVNDYPGDEALPALRQTFTFSGYWLNVPPGATTNSWAGRRAELVKNGFGFLILFNGRLSKELQPPVDAGDLGVRDADAAVAAALREGFSPGMFTLIYLDIEEGGRMLPPQLSYVNRWSARVALRGFAAGVYCSGMKVNEGKGQSITTADDIRERVPIAAYFIYNDACPPSPGCVYLKNPPKPSQSGFPGARVWQFAQSPRRRNFTGPCGATYSADGNCYPPAGTAAGRMLLDLDSSDSPDPSSARIHAID